MVCDICGKNQATVHLTEIIDGQVSELHLCEECAHKKSMEMEQQFGLSELLAGMMDLEKASKDKESTNLKCPNCGLSYADFKKIGRLGCSECYVIFKKYLGPLLKRIHGSLVHCGKVPAKAKATSKKKLSLEELREKLKDAIEREAYEEAAHIRDQIKELEKRKEE